MGVYTIYQVSSCYNNCTYRKQISSLSFVKFLQKTAIIFLHIIKRSAFERRPSVFCEFYIDFYTNYLGQSAVSVHPSLTTNVWRWRQYAPLKRWQIFTSQIGVNLDFDRNRHKNVSSGVAKKPSKIKQAHTIYYSTL